MKRAKTVAVMQPYFVPYAGYFRLFAAADEVVMLDNVQFPRRGHVHRNRLRRRDGALDWLTLPLRRAPFEAEIRDLRFAENPSKEICARLQRFRASVARGVGSSALYDAIPMTETRAPVDFIVDLLSRFCGLLELPFVDLRASRLSLPEGLRGQDRILAIASCLGATTYLNLAGGRSLYDPSAFMRHGIRLRVLAPYSGPIDSICERLDTEAIHDVVREIQANCAD